MTKYSTKKALISSIVVLALCFTMLVGTTFAWFTDSATSTGNIIKTGNLDVEMYYADGTKAVPAADSTNWLDASKDAIFDYDNWEPGYAQVRHIKIANKGSLALKYKVNIVPNGEFSDLTDVIDVYYVDPATQIENGSALTNDMKIGNLTGVLDNLGISGNGELKAGESDTITIAFKMNEQAGNEYMNKSLGADFAVQILATQLTSENDSFGNQYDATAGYPETATLNRNDATVDDYLTAGDVTVLLSDNAPEGSYKLLVSNKSVAINENGETVASYDIDLTKDGVKAENGNGYEVSINVGEALNLTGVLHNGEAINDFSYSPITGIVSFTTTSFSPFAVVYTAYPENTAFVSDANELQAAIASVKGEKGNDDWKEINIVLTDDIVFDATSEAQYTSGSNFFYLYIYRAIVTLDLNGHDITATEDAVVSGYTKPALILTQYATLNVVGDGNVVCENKGICIYNWAHSTVSIYGGNYVSNANERKESAIYVNNTNSKTYVYGGTYMDSPFAFNCHNTSCTDVVIVLSEGITFVDFQNHFRDDYNGGRIAIAEGCELKSVADGDNIIYSVVKAQG